MISRSTSVRSSGSTVAAKMEPDARRRCAPHRSARGPCLLPRDLPHAPRSSPGPVATTSSPRDRGTRARRTSPGSWAGRPVPSSWRPTSSRERSPPAWGSPSGVASGPMRSASPRSSGMCSRSPDGSRAGRVSRRRAARWSCCFPWIVAGLAVAVVPAGAGAQAGVGRLDRVHPGVPAPRDRRRLRLDRGGRPRGLWPW